MRPLRRWLANRPTIILREPVISRFYGMEYGANVEYLIEEKRREWLNKGVPENFVNMAIKLIKNWTTSMYNYYKNLLSDLMTENELKVLYHRIFKMSLEVADKWISEMTGITV